MPKKIEQEVAGMSREDLIENFPTHYKDKFQSIESDSGGAFTTLSQAMNAYSPAIEGDICEDALLDALTRQDLRMDIHDDVEASTIAEVFQSSETNNILGTEYLERCFSDSIWSKDVQFAPENVTRGGQTEPFDPPTYGYYARRMYQPRVQLRHIIAERIPVSGSEYHPGILDTVEDNAITPVSEGAKLPSWTLTSSEDNVRMRKLGYMIKMSQEFYSDSNRRINLLVKAQRQKAAQVENALVDQGLQMIGADTVTGSDQAGAVAVAFTDIQPTNQEVINLHLRPDDNYMIDTLIGTLEAVSGYLTAPIYYASGNMVPGAPRGRNMLDMVVGVETIGKKSPDDVATLKTDPAKPVMLAFDSKVCLEYCVSRRGMVSQQGMDIEDQTIILTNSHRYGFYLTPESDRCRYRVVFG